MLQKVHAIFKGRRGYCNGKQLITEVTSVLREKFGIVCRKNDFISAMNVHNVSSELLDVLKLFN